MMFVFIAAGTLSGLSSDMETTCLHQALLVDIRKYLFFNERLALVFWN